MNNLFHANHAFQALSLLTANASEKYLDAFHIIQTIFVLLAHLLSNLQLVAFAKSSAALLIQITDVLFA
jgi:hypothetical protein